MQLPAPSRDYSMSLSEVTLSSHRRVSRKRCSHGTLSGKQKPTHGTLSGVAYMRSSHIRRWSTNSWPCVQGALARACLQAGIQYIGVFRKAEHASGLINVLNRAAVELIRRNGTALYEQDLAPCLEDHFKELIEELNAQDAAVSEEEDNQ